jgi:hypothetical protein
LYLGQRTRQSSGLFYGFFSTESGGLCPELLSGLQSGLRAGLCPDLPAGPFPDQPGQSHVFAWECMVESGKARGMTEAVLQAIRTDVFNVAAPIGP